MVHTCISNTYYSSTMNEFVVYNKVALSFTAPKYTVHVKAGGYITINHNYVLKIVKTTVAHNFFSF